MATSGVDVITRTARDVIKRAYVLINVTPATQDVPAADEAYAVDALNDMMQGWTAKGVTPWRKQSGTFTPIADQREYTITQRPLDIISLRWVETGGTEIPLTEVTHDEYFDLSNKAVTGQPSLFYFRRDRTTSTVFLYPTPRGPITTQTLAMTYNRRTQIVVPANVATEEVDVPQEWLDTVVYCLAERLSESYGAEGGQIERVIARANMMFEEMMMYEREGEIAFYPDYTF